MTPIPMKQAAVVGRLLLLCSIMVCYGDEKVSHDTSGPAPPYSVYKFACARSEWPPEVSQPYPGRGPIQPNLGLHSSYGRQPRAQDDFYIAFSPISRYCRLGEPVPASGTDEAKLQVGEKSCADRSAEYAKLHKACPVGSRPIMQTTQEDPPRLPSAVRSAGDAVLCYQLCEDIPLTAR
jgi:hypothetical protein